MKTIHQAVFSGLEGYLLLPRLLHPPRQLRRDLVTSPSTTTHGYWLVGSDGGIFTFGSAVFHGSTGSTRPATTRRRHRSDQRRWWLLARRLRWRRL